ncbi:MAG: NAD+ synthase [Dehalococcoidia bacterium]
MSRILRIALAQINTSVGDLDGNARKITDGIAAARAAGAAFVAFPELAITGYPPEDLVLHPRFVADNRARLAEVARAATGIAAVVGFVDGLERRGTPAYNAAALLDGGRVVHVYRKIHLPNYGVFDERRYFAPGDECPVLELPPQGAGEGTGGPARIGISICEDVWEPVGPVEVQRAAGAEVSVNINASPFEAGKHRARLDLISGLARRNQVFACYVNQVGGQDELVFDGTSLVFGPDGRLMAEGARFEEDLLVLDLDLDEAARVRSELAWTAPPQRELADVGRPAAVVAGAARRAPLEALPPRAPRAALSPEGEVYRALVLGTRDYVRKAGFEKVVIALSGGIDSTLTAAVAVDALGAVNVLGIALPSRYSSEGSLTDAADLADRLGIELWTVPIEPAHGAFEEMLEARFTGTTPGVAEENVQARIRGNIMMTISNKFGRLVLTTGNKSEMATGYATLYGDMAGGFAVIKDVPKTLVYRLCEYRNRCGPGSPIPQAVIEKPPSAELRPGQLDRDSLPPYEGLDRLLERYVEERLDAAEIIAAEDAVDGPRADAGTVRRLLAMVDRNEHKRRQAPPGVKITGLAFGRDRRMPIASRYRPH